jgi:hypothetical protein
MSSPATNELSKEQPLGGMEQDPHNDLPETEKPQGPPEVPEGGVRGWLAVLGCWCVMFITWGYINAFGYVEENYIFQ